MPKSPPAKRWSAIIGVAVVAIIVSFTIAAFSNHARKDRLRVAMAAQRKAQVVADRHLCDMMNIHTAILTEQLKLALERARVSIPNTPKSRQLRRKQIDGIKLGINALESTTC